MTGLLVNLALLVILACVIWWLLTQLPLPGPLMTVIQIIFVVIFVVILVSIFLQLVGKAPLVPLRLTNAVLLL